MAKAVLQSNIQASDGGLTVAAGATVTIRNSDTLGLATLYTDRAGGTTTANPTTADADGFFRVYIDAGRYNITATYSGDTQTFNDVVTTDDAVSFDELVNTTDNNQRIDASGTTNSQSTYLGSTSVQNNVALRLETDNAGARLQAFGTLNALSGKILLTNTANNGIILGTGNGTARCEVNHSGGLSIEDDAPATPLANTLYADSMVKAWAVVVDTGGGPSLSEGINVASLDDSVFGRTRVNFATAMANTTYAAIPANEDASFPDGTVIVQNTLKATGYVEVQGRVSAAGQDIDLSVIVVGEQ